MRSLAATIGISFISVFHICNHLVFAQPGIAFITRLSNRTNSEIFDIYATTDGGYVVTGASWGREQVNYQDNERNLWVSKLDEEFEVVWTAEPDLAGTGEDGYTIIEADNGDFIIGGIKQNQDDQPDWESAICRLTSNGDVIWFRAYGHRSFQAIIELKGGSFVACGGGYEERRGWGRVMCFNQDGEILWDTFITGIGEHAAVPAFYTMRETDGGIVVAGRSSRRIGVIGDSHVFAAKLNFNGEVLWRQDYSQMGYRQECLAMVSSADGGFWLAGQAADTLDRIHITGDFLLMKINSEGERQNFHRYHIPWDVGQQLLTSEIDAIAKFEDGTMALIGEQLNTDIGRRPVVIHVTTNGEELWQQVFQMHEFDDHLHENGSGFQAGIRAHDASILCAGRTFVLDDIQHWEGLIVKYEPFAIDNRILEYLPVDLDLTVLVGDTMSFGVRPVGAWGGADSVGYLWILDNRDTLSCDPSVLIQFDEQRDYQVKGEVFIGDTSAAVTWVVHSVDIYIVTSTPDTTNLQIHRGATIDFSLDSVAAIANEQPLQYQWIMARSGDHGEIIGTDSSVQVDFPLSGHYTVEGMVYREESFDEKVWGIQVAGAIWTFIPEQTQFETRTNSTVEFILIPTTTDSLNRYIWLYDDIVMAEGNDSCFIVDFYDPGEHSVMGVLTDSLESDTVIWTVNVTQVRVEDNQTGSADSPTRFGVLSVTPNPFNSTVVISFAFPPMLARGEFKGGVSLTIHDISGREVFSTVRSSNLTAAHVINSRGVTDSKSIVWDASTFPAGIYFARLEAGGEVRAVKMVLVR